MASAAWFSSMVASMSAAKRAKFIGTALIFSGRPDPAWPVPRHSVRQLQEIWKSLEPWLGKPAVPPVLGYRGCLLRAPKGRQWFAYNGLVVLKANRHTEARRDREKRFEKTLLSSAPKGLIPTLSLGADWTGPPRGAGGTRSRAW